MLRPGGPKYESKAVATASRWVSTPLHSYAPWISPPFWTLDATLSAFLPLRQATVSSNICHSFPGDICLRLRRCCPGCTCCSPGFIFQHRESRCSPVYHFSKYFSMNSRRLLADDLGYQWPPSHSGWCPLIPGEESISAT